MAFKFRVEGKSQGKARARTFLNKHTGKMNSITPEKTRSYEDLIRWSYKEAGGQFLGDKPVFISIAAYFPIPASWSKKKKYDAAHGMLRPTVKPDCDNICKVMLDALNGVAYADDKQVVAVLISKNYADQAYVEVIIDRVDNEPIESEVTL